MFQQEMIERLRAVAEHDGRIVAVLMYGSFATGEADLFSDIEFAVFLGDEDFAAFDRHSWLEAVSPVAAFFADDFGHETALFSNTIRGEFHFLRRSDLPVVATWQEHGWLPSLDAGVLLDRTGELAAYVSALVGGPPARGGAMQVQSLVLNLLNLMLLGGNLLHRGEYARAWALLGRAHEPLLKLVRLHERRIDHWPTPSRALEDDLSIFVRVRYQGCTGSAEPDALCAAYRATWQWGRELFATVGGPLVVDAPVAIVDHVQRLIDTAGGRSANW